MIDKRRLSGILGRTTKSPVVPIINNKGSHKGRKRGPEDIKAELLIVASNPIMKTAAMSRCNLSFSQIEKYARILISKDLMLVENNNGRQTFTTTRRGQVWLGQLRKLRAIENGADISDASYIT